MKFMKIILLLTLFTGCSLGAFGKKSNQAIDNNYLDTLFPTNPEDGGTPSPENSVPTYKYSTRNYTKILHHGSSSVSPTGSINEQKNDASFIYTTYFELTDPDNGISFNINYSDNGWGDTDSISTQKTYNLSDSSGTKYVYYLVTITRKHVSDAEYDYALDVEKVVRTTSSQTVAVDMKMKSFLKLLDTSNGQSISYENSPAFWAGNGVGSAKTINFTVTGSDGTVYNKYWYYTVDIDRTVK